MDRETQKMFFQNSIDLDVITDYVNNLVETLKEAGEPKKLRIELRDENEFEQGLSPDEIINKIDQEYSSNIEDRPSLLRTWKLEKYYLIVGVNL